MTASDSIDFIQNVSDTSAWVAHYRALETARPDALFHDPFARLLVGDRVAGIEELRSETTKWTQWTVVMRTYIIDQMIHDLIAEGGTTFLNLGAGLDSRPYRLKLGPEIRWLEVDFPGVIEHKQKVLREFAPTCKLETVPMDLADRSARRALFARLADDTSKVAVLTEGVLPYLTEVQVAELSEDLVLQANFHYWICEFISEKSYRYLKDPKRMKVLKNAPFQFYPADWLGFFKARGWTLDHARYYSEVSENFGRPTPLPKILSLFEWFLGKKWAAPFKQMSGFLLWKR